MQKIIIVIAAALFLVLSSALYTVNETQTAIKLRLGEIVMVEPELSTHFGWSQN